MNGGQGIGSHAFGRVHFRRRGQRESDKLVGLLARARQMLGGSMLGMPVGQLPLDVAPMPGEHAGALGFVHPVERVQDAPAGVLDRLPAFGAGVGSASDHFLKSPFHRYAKIFTCSSASGIWSS